VYIPYFKGVADKFKRIGNWCNIRTIFRTKHTLRSSLMKTRPERDPQQHAHNLKEGLLEKNKISPTCLREWS
jgi:hypothetical protein